MGFPTQYSVGDSKVVRSDWHSTTSGQVVTFSRTFLGWFLKSTVFTAIFGSRILVYTVLV